MKGLLLKTIGVALLLTVSISGALAQEPAAANGVSTKVQVTVEARNGKSVPTVTAEDVSVLQGKTRDKVTGWVPISQSQAAPEFFLLIDDSASTQSFGTQLPDIRQFIQNQPANVSVGVAYMRNGIAQIAQTLTKDHAQAAKAVRLPLGTAAEGASPYFSLQDLVKKWPKDSDVRQVLMITDGVDAYWGGFGLNDPYVDAAIADCQRAGVMVYSIYTRASGHFGHSLFRINQAQSLLSETTDATGGESYYLGSSSPVTFTPYFNAIRERLDHQFVLTFLAQPVKKSGLQQVRLATEVPNADLVAQRSVYVAAE
jgi:hypothetical protein